MALVALSWHLCTNGGLTLSWGQYQNNVCTSIEAYFNNMDKNPNCWYDGDVNADPEHLAKNHGVILESHDINTPDGYILTTFRLRSVKGFYGKEVIFLQHGLGTDAECFMLNGNKSLAFFLLRQGFDVWLGNYRGGDYSRHRSLSRDNSKFWDFSFHEHGLYDLACNFEYINKQTKRKINYIGHSMGGTAMGIYASMKAKEAEIYIKHAILMGAPFHLRATKGLLHFYQDSNLYMLLTQVAETNIRVLLATNSFERQIFQNVCFSSLDNARLCLYLVDLSSGKSQNIMAPGRKFTSVAKCKLNGGTIVSFNIKLKDPRDQCFFASTVASTKITFHTAATNEGKRKKEKMPRALKAFKNVGFKDVLHYAQLIRSGDFRMFDYGSKKNMIVYNTTVPPSYDLSQITIPMSLIYFNQDNLATKSDITYTFEKFRKPNWNIYGQPYNHFNFLIARNVDKTMYPFLLNILNKYIL